MKCSSGEVASIRHCNDAQPDLGVGDGETELGSQRLLSHLISLKVKRCLATLHVEPVADPQQPARVRRRPSQFAEGSYPAAHPWIEIKDGVTPPSDDINLAFCRQRRENQFQDI